MSLQAIFDPMVKAYFKKKYGGGGGGGFPEKIYEADFIIEESLTSGENTVCTISTGLSTRIVADDKEIVMVVVTCEPTDTAVVGYTKAVNLICPFYDGAATTYTNNVMKTTDGAKWRIAHMGVFIKTVTSDLSTLTIVARCDMVKAPAGNYHLELYRTGFDLK
jgi:hypothetical protein